MNLITLNIKEAYKHLKELIARIGNQNCKGKIRKDGSIVYCHKRHYTKLACRLLTEIEAQKDNEYIKISPIKMNGFPR
jgi:hypothetical protein